MPKPLLIMSYGQSNADRHLTKPRLPSPLLDDPLVVTLTAGMGVRGCGYNEDGTIMARMGEFTINGRRVQKQDLPPFLPAVHNEVAGTSMLHVAGAVARLLTDAPLAAVRAAAKGGLRFVAPPQRDGVMGIYRLADGTVSPVLSMLIDEAATMKAHLQETCNDAPSVIYLLFVHGEADRSTKVEDYVQQFREARALISEGLAAHGLTPRWLLTQAAGTSAAGDGNAWRSRLAVMQSLADDPDMVFVGPMYAYPLIDHIHYDSVGKALIGELSGHIIAMLENGEPWDTPFVQFWTLSGNMIRLHCHAPEPLALEEGLEGVQHHGFSIADSLDIRHVELEGASTIAITLGAVPDTKFNLDYAFRRTSRLLPEPVQRYCYGRGAVRTSWKLASELVPGETLRKWLPGFRLEIDPKACSEAGASV